MTKISGSTFFCKKLFPALWVGILALFLLVNWVSGESTSGSYFLLVGMVVFGFFAIRKGAWDLVDEVYDAGDQLIFKKDGLEQRVRLEDVVHIDYQHNHSPERVTVSCRHAGAIGKELVFCPPSRFFGFKKAPIVSELIVRVDRAKRA